MSALHPKLNWEEFERVRAARKRRKFWLWFGLSFSLIALVGAASYWVYEPTHAPTGSTAGKQEQVASKQEQAQQPELASAGESKHSTQRTTPDQRTQSTAVTQTKAVAAAREVRPLVAVEAQEEEQTIPAAGEKQPATDAAVPAVTEQSVEPQPAPASPTAPIPSLAAAATIDSLPPVAEVQSAAKKARKPLRLDSWISLAWVPWHTAELRTDQAPTGGSLQYRPLNSANLSFGVAVLTRERWQLSIAPQYALQRFQMQLKGDLESFQIAPGTIVGYIQDFKGIEPIISDTVRGKSLVRAYANGAQHDLFLPVTFSAQLWSRNSLQVRFNVSAGMNYVLTQRGQWFNGAEIYTLNAASSRFGLLGAGGLQLVYQPGRIAYQLAVQSMYRTATSANQLPWRNQLGVSVTLPIIK